MITPDELRDSNRRTLWFAVIILTCLSLLAGASFLLIIALERSYGTNWEGLFVQYPRAMATLIVGLIIFSAMIMILVTVIIRGIKRSRKDRSKERKMRRKACRQAKAEARRAHVFFDKEAFLFNYDLKRREEMDSVVRYVDTPSSLNEAGATAAPIPGVPASVEIKADSLDTQKKAEHRFPSLSDYDALHPSFEEVVPDQRATLASLVEGFRSYAASQKGLFYSHADIRAFLSSLSCSKTMILQGMSGTGKTSLPVAFGEYLSSPTDVVPVQPTWKERSDVLGYYNEFTGVYSESQLLKSLYAASGTDAIRVVVLDEANIARVEYYFAEFLSLLELPEGPSRRLPVAPSGMEGDPKRMQGGSIPLPGNVWFILTANNDDSTFSFSDKVYDRASVIDLDSRAEPFASPKAPGARMSAPRLEELFAEARARYALTSRDERRIAQLDESLRSLFGVSFGNRVMLQIRGYVPVYAACGGPTAEALDQILSRKVLRKLGAVNPVLLRAKAPELLSTMASLFGEGGAPLCEKAIKRIADL